MTELGEETCIAMHTNYHRIGALLRLRIVELIIYFNVLHKSLEYYNWDVFKIFFVNKIT